MKAWPFHNHKLLTHIFIFLVSLFLCKTQKDYKNVNYCLPFLYHYGLSCMRAPHGFVGQPWLIQIGLAVFSSVFYLLPLCPVLHSTQKAASLIREGSFFIFEVSFLLSRGVCLFLTKWFFCPCVRMFLHSGCAYNKKTRRKPGAALKTRL